MLSAPIALVEGAPRFGAARGEGIVALHRPIVLRTDAARPGKPRWPAGGQRGTTAESPGVTP